MNRLGTAPGIESFIPTNAILVNALDNNNKLRNMVLLYDKTDGWLGKEDGWYIHEELGVRMNRLLHEDNTVIGFRNQFYRIQNGIYTLSSQTVPVRK